MPDQRATMVRGDLFQECCDHIFFNNTNPFPNPHFKSGSIVFCKTDALFLFFEQLRLTRKRIILVTGESDLPCDSFRQYFLPKNVVHWFSPNVTHAHPRVSAIPLGLGTPNDSLTLKHADFLVASKKELPKDHWLLVSFRPETNPHVRQPIYDHFEHLSQNESWITFQSPHDPSPTANNDFLSALLSHYFVLCPPGNGVDTHRLWETLAAGSYPVIWISEAMRPFESLPIVFVNHIEEITLDFLKKQLPQLEEKKKNLFMLEMLFWKHKIQQKKQNLYGREMMSWHQWLQESFRYGLGMIHRRFF
jgi:hypothetical protein